MQKIRIEFILDDQRDLENIYRVIRNRFLGTLSDYQRDNLNLFVSNDVSELTLQAFPDEFLEPARCRTALRDVLDYINREVT